MAKTYSTKKPDRDASFITHELLEAQNLAGKVRGYDMISSTDELEMFLTMAREFTERELLPLYNRGEAESPTFEKESGVKLSEDAKKAYAEYTAHGKDEEMGFTALTAEETDGGLELPELLFTAISERLNSGNMAWSMITTLTQGAYAAIRDHGSDKVKGMFLPGLVDGTVSGAMDMTETGAGTGLGATKTKALPIEGETDEYEINGDKIFITFGDHDATDNIVHLVLGRLPDAPEGVKGLTLFAVPKLIEGQTNGVTAEGIEEEKMGLHQSPTCEMKYENAKGYLVGEENGGMEAMFTMMNEARLHVGVQAIGVVEAAYQNALKYVKDDRIVDGKPLIEKDDVRRKLLEMRSMVESGRSLAAFTSMQMDIAHHHEDLDERENAQKLADLLTPVIKGHFTRRGVQAVREGLELLGGYGYSKDYPMAEMDEDLAVTPIYEGVNAVQGLAVLRSLGTINVLTDQIREFTEANKDNDSIAQLSRIVELGARAVDKQAKWLIENKGDMQAEATDFMHLLGKVASGYMLAKSAAIAHEKLQSGELAAGDKEFYEGKIDTAEFQIKRVLQKEINPQAARRTGKETLRIRDIRPELAKPSPQASSTEMQGDGPAVSPVQK